MLVIARIFRKYAEELVIELHYPTTNREIVEAVGVRALEQLIAERIGLALDERGIWYAGSVRRDTWLLSRNRSTLG